MANPTDLVDRPLFALVVAATLVLPGLGCNDYGVHGDNDPYGDDDDDTVSGDDDDAGSDDDDGADDDDDDAYGDDDDAGSDDDDDDITEPPETLESCDDGASFQFDDSDGDGWLVVLSWSPTEDSGTIWVDTSAYYHLYDSYIAESGASQTNESGYLTVTNSGNPTGLPVIPNCDGFYIVTDSDNGGTPSGSVYLGTFLLQAGEPNDVTLWHYCPLFRSGACTQLHNGDPYADDGGCESYNANSIHMDMSGICLVPA